MSELPKPRWQPPRPGRPSLYSEDLASTILERLACGESLRAICRDESMPDRSSVMRWAVRDDRFRVRYTHARELQTAAWLDEIHDHLNTEPARDPEGKLDPLAIRHHRNRLGTLRWLADKLRARTHQATLGG